MTSLMIQSPGVRPPDSFPVPVTVKVTPLPLDIPADTGSLALVPIVLPHGHVSDARQILSALALLGIRYGQEPLVRICAEKILGADHPDNDTAGAVDKFLIFVKKTVRYMPDPDGMEYVTSPIELLSRWLKKETVMGDCDDHVLLLDALCLSVGIPARPVGIQLPGSGWFNHVISQVFINGRWVDLDPCAKDMEQPLYLNRMELTA